MEDLKLRIEFDTAQALDSANTFTAAIRDQAAAFRELDSASDEAKSGLRTLGNAAEKTTEKLSEAGPAAKSAASGFSDINQSLTQINVTAPQTTTNITNIAAETKDSGDKASFATPLVHAWLAEYFSIQAINELLKIMAERLKDVQDAQEALADARAKANRDNRAISRAFNVDDEGAEATVKDVSDTSGSSREQARSAILAAGIVGDPTKKGSAANGVAIAGAAAARVGDLDDRAVSDLVKLGQQTDFKTGEGIKTLYAKIAAAAPSGSDPASFVKGATPQLLASNAQGADLDETLALLGTLSLKTGGDVSTAGGMVQQLRGLTVGGNDKRDKFFADQAVKSGVIMDGGYHFDPDKDAGVMKARLALSNKQVEQDDAQEKLDEDRKKTPKSRKRAEYNAEQEAIQSKIEQDEKALAGKQKEVDAERGKVDAAISKVRDAANLADYRGLSADNKLQNVIIPAVAAAATDSERNAIAEAMGIRATSAVFDVASQGGKDIAALRSKVGSATSKDFQAAVDQYDQSDRAQDVNAQRSIEESQVNATSAGTAYQKRILDLAKNDVMIETGGDGTFDPNSIKSLASSTDKRVNISAANRLKAELDKLRADDPVANRKILDDAEFGDLFGPGGVDRVISDPNFLKPERDAYTLSKAAEAIGNVRKQRADQQRRESHPAAPPTPVAGSAGADAGDVHYHTNVYHQEQYHTMHSPTFFSGGDRDLPGAWEQSDVNA